MKLAGDSQGERLIPEVAEEDIQEVESRWRMAFDADRRKILRSNDSFDVLACPGSGKTTLLVAKLAILAKKWPHSRRGICVLSHTNVARQEIEEKLAGTGVGERLLDYPHFVGTIHAFLNCFLALPLLRSEGHLVRLIDDDACFGWMNRYLLSTPTRFQLGDLVHKKRVLDKHIRRLVCAGSPLALTKPSDMDEKKWGALRAAKQKAITQGIFYHADMIGAAERLLVCHPEALALVRWRFPVVLLDEAQDTSEGQGRILAQVFPIKECVLRQRFGDSNQAIYDREKDRAVTDPFPGSEVRWIANSQRFGQTIAAKAQPLAPVQPQPYLIGSGPPNTCFPELGGVDQMPHTLFLFSEGSIKGVMPAFAQLLLGTFPPAILRSERFWARAIGRVGRTGSEAEGEGEKFPKSLSDYWSAYEPRVAKLEPRPDKLADFIHLAQRQRAASADCAPAITTAARGIFRLIELLVPNVDTASGRYLKGVRELLATDRSAEHALIGLLWGWCVEAATLKKENWTPQLKVLRRALAPIIGDRREDDAHMFCEWSEAFVDGVASAGRVLSPRLANRYYYPEEGPLVAIDVGTIHSAKGQTHTATLVLETFSWGHDLGDLLDWLIGVRNGSGKEKKIRRLDRLRLIYTAMTRPTHLLCLALREEALDSWMGGREEAVRAFRNRGWQVRRLSGGG